GIRDASYLTQAVSTEREPPFPSLRTGAVETETTAAPLSTPFGVSDSIELVVDLLSTTKLVPEDKLALARGRAQQTRSLGTALVEEGIASSEGIARMLAARHQLPLVDLAVIAVNEDAARQLPLHVLERIGAIPYAFKDGRLQVAVGDPANLHGLDELRLATRHPLELGVASREDIMGAIRKLVRASEAFGARAAVDADQDLLAFEAEEDVTDLE